MSVPTTAVSGWASAKSLNRPVSIPFAHIYNDSLAYMAHNPAYGWLVTPGDVSIRRVRELTCAGSHIENSLRVYVSLAVYDRPAGTVHTYLNVILYRSEV